MGLRPDECNRTLPTYQDRCRLVYDSLDWWVGLALLNVRESET